MNINFLYIIVVLLITFISVILHELAHGYVAYWLGDDTAKSQGRLTLNPIRHIDLFLTILLPLSLALVGAPIFGGAKPVPFNPGNLRGKEWGVAAVALAGPLTNFILAFLAFGILCLFGMNGGLWVEVVELFVQINLGICVFNLVPIPPLDGSRLLYALAPDGARKIMKKMENFGIWIVLILVIFGNTAIASLMTFAINGILYLFGCFFGA